MAGAGKKTFTAGDLLYASPDVNDYLMDQMVMTFGGTAERGSAIPTPSEGMITYLSDSKTINFYNGSSWQPNLASALQLVKTQTIGTAVSSITVTGAFNADYDNYLIEFVGGTSTGGSIDLELGTTTTGYYRVRRNLTYANVATTDADQNVSSFNGVAYTNNGVFGNIIYLFTPFLSARTGIYSTVTTNSTLRINYGFLNNAQSYTDFTLDSSGTITDGTIYVYGFKKE
jgi:hypothetical protein